MTPGARAAAAIEVLADIEARKRPATAKRYAPLEGTYVDMLTRIIHETRSAVG